MRKIRWELGSDFHWPDLTDKEPSTYAVPWRGSSLWTSGRGALAALIQARRWRRLWTPSYFCQQTTAALAATGIELTLYPDTPLSAEPDLEGIRCANGDAILIVNTLGLRRAPSRAQHAQVEIIEDHSHDPLSGWSLNSSADWCVASLRKTLPLPVGGVVWSPAGHQRLEPPRLGHEGESIASEKLAAMLLKRAYLAGGPVRKALFRARFRHAEEEIAGVGGVAAPSWIADLLDLMPVSPWREIRRRNATALAAHLRALGLDVLISNDRNTVPFVVPVMLDNRRTAQRIRQGLARRKVYSPRLWDLDRPVVKPISAAGHNLSHRLLCLHCDHRYGAEDMRRVADILSELIVK